MTIHIAFSKWFHKPTYFAIITLAMVMISAIACQAFRWQYFLYIMFAVALIDILMTAIFTHSLSRIPAGYAMGDTLFHFGAAISILTAFAEPMIIVVAVLIFAISAIMIIAYYHKANKLKNKRYMPFVLMDIKMSFAAAMMIPVAYCLS